MKSVFADTSYWVALLYEKDSKHDIAVDVTERIGQVRLVTSEMVLTEFLNFFSGHGAKARLAASQFTRNLKNKIFVKITHQTNILFDEALFLYSEMADKSWSLTDCASMVIMKNERIGTVLSADKHFVQAGYQILLIEENLNQE